MTDVLVTLLLLALGLGWPSYAIWRTFHPVHPLLEQYRRAQHKCERVHGIGRVTPHDGVPSSR